jgi:hypothetical protein
MLATFIPSFAQSRASGEMLSLRFGRMCKVHLRAFQTYLLRSFSGRDEGVLLTFLNTLLFSLQSFAARALTNPPAIPVVRVGAQSIR